MRVESCPVHGRLPKELLGYWRIAKHLKNQPSVRPLKNLMLRLELGQLAPYLFNCRICIHTIMQDV
jgi:hypothetical protein